MMMFIRMKLSVPQWLSMEIVDNLVHNLSMMVLGIPLGTMNLRIDTIMHNIDLYLHGTITTIQVNP